MVCFPEKAGPFVKQVRAYVSFITAGVVGACGSGFRDVSMHTRAMLRVGRVAVRARGQVRACVRGGELGLCLCVALSCTSVIMAGAVGVRVTGFKGVSMHVSVGVRVGRMPVRVRGRSRACVRWWGLEGCSGLVLAGS